MAVSPEDFVRIWQGAENLRAVTDKTGLTVQNCTTRAQNYRNKGIPLKRFRLCKKLDIESLTKLAKSLETGNGKHKAK